MSLCEFFKWGSLSRSHVFWCFVLYDLDALRSSPCKGVKDPKVVNRSPVAKEFDMKEILEEVGTQSVTTRAFSFVQLVAATDNFKSDYFLGEGGFGKVYRGELEDTGQVG